MKIIYEVGDIVITKKDSQSNDGKDLAGTPIKITEIVKGLGYFSEYVPMNPDATFPNTCGGIYFDDIERIATPEEVEQWVDENEFKPFTLTIDNKRDFDLFYTLLDCCGMTQCLDIAKKHNEYYPHKPEVTGADLHVLTYDLFQHMIHLGN